MHILYVEDDETNVKFVERVAQMGNYYIWSCPTAEEALNYLDVYEPDLLLIDFRLEGDMNGLEMVRVLRNGGYQNPIIAVTAYATHNECVAAGCDDSFEKPISPDELLMLLKHYEPQV